MSQRSVEHTTFVIERRYPVPRRRVYAAWANPEAKARWFGGSNDDYDLDFRIGGQEVSRGTAPDGTVYSFDARYEDIVPDERIVFTYYMLMGETRISVSVATVVFNDTGDGTHLVYTEQGAFLDGHDDPRQREHGTRELLDALKKHLAEPVA